MASRACASAEDVTVQVLTTTNSAVCGEAEVCSRGPGAGARWQRRRLGWRGSRIVRCRRWTWCTHWVDKKFNTEGAESTEDAEKRQRKSRFRTRPNAAGSE